MLRRRRHGSKAALTRSNASAQTHRDPRRGDAICCPAPRPLLPLDPLATAICCPPLKHESALLIHNLCGCLVEGEWLRKAFRWKQALDHGKIELDTLVTFGCIGQTTDLVILSSLK